MIGTGLARRVVLSPNIEARPEGCRPRFLVLHYTGMATAEKACAWLCTPHSKVSCHYLIDQNGEITQMVGEELRAWHAGQSSWDGEGDINSWSIGIEIQNPGHGGGYPDFPQMQMHSVAALSSDIIARHHILPQHVLAHSDVAPGRKIDPGEKFDWAYLHGRGVGHWVPAGPIAGGVFLQEGDKGDAVAALQSLLKLYGYNIDTSGEYGIQTRVVVAAFQRHFRPGKIDGVADHSTVATLHRLLKERPAASV